MAESGRLLAPAIPGWVYILMFGTVCTLGQVVFQHARYVSILKWLTLSLFAYFATLCVVHVRWSDALQGLFWPHFATAREFWITVVAILGTTISPYLFFWQAAQEVEDTKAEPARRPLKEAPRQGPAALARIELDTMVGMAFSNLVALAILITAAATLHHPGGPRVESAAQAAEALRPLAGTFAFALFALGIIGTGLLSVPVLAGSAAYALGEARGWPVGLSRRPPQAKAFYGAIGGATLLGALGNFWSFNPIQALVWAAVINGVVAVPVMVLLMLMSRRKQIMGEFRITGLRSLVGWVATVIMACAAIALTVATVAGDT